jgi:hypothetical protein
MTPGGALDSEIIGAFLPLVFGTATSLLPEKPEAAPSICAAVFEAFKIRWRRLSSKTLLAAWFLRSAWFAVQAERKRLGLPKLQDSPARKEFNVLKRLLKLPRPASDAIILVDLLGVSPNTAAEALNSRPKKIEKSRAMAMRKLEAVARKHRLNSPVIAILKEFCTDPPPMVEEEVSGIFSAPDTSQRESRASFDILTRWRNRAITGFITRLLKFFGTVITVAGIAIGTFAFLAGHGYLTPIFIRMQARQTLKEVPELAVPARAWPVTAEERDHLPVPPATAAELYDEGKIWPAKLFFSRDSWERLQPSHVQPVGNMMGPDGRLILRNPKAKRSGLTGVIGLEFNWSDARLDFDGQLFEKVAVRYRGNGTYLNSLYGPKQSFKVDLNKITKKQKLAGIKELNFLNCIADNAYMFDVLSERMFRDLGVPAPRTTYSYLTVDAPGAFTNQPLGLYIMVENIDATFAEDRFGSKSTPIFKPVTYELFSDLGNEWKNYEAIYDLKTKASPEQENRVIEFSKLLTHASDAVFARRLPEFINQEEFAGFLAGHVLTSSYDGFLSNGQNYYLYLDASNRFGFISWDQDHSWGEFRYVGTVEKRENASIWAPAAYDSRFLNRALKVESFRQLYRAKLEFALEHLFTTNRLYGQIDQLASNIRSAVAAESDFRLKRFDIAIGSQWTPGPREGGPPEGPQSRVHQIKRFIPARIKSIRDQLDGKTSGARLTRN